MFALQLSRAAGARVILTSSSDEKLKKMRERYSTPPILTVNYGNSQWHEEVMQLTEGKGVDVVVENGGAPSLVQSIKCTRRGGTVSQVGYLGSQDPEMLRELIPTIIDRRVVLRYVDHSLGSSASGFDRLISIAGASTPAPSMTWKTSVKLFLRFRCR